MTKVVDEKIDEGVLRWFGHVERVENDRIVRRVYLGECAGSRSVGRARKRWIGTVKEYLRKGGLDARPSRRMVHDRSVWWGFVSDCYGNCVIWLLNVVQCQKTGGLL